MKSDILTQFVALKKSLESERTTLVARLKDIETVLAGVELASAPVAKSVTAAAAPLKRKRRLSAAGRAAIIAGTKARWARIRAAKAAKAPKRKGQLSAAGRAAIVAAQKARWAKTKAGKAPKAAKAPKVAKALKRKGQLSAAGRAAIVAAQKARWAKIKAAKT